LDSALLFGQYSPPVTSSSDATYKLSGTVINSVSSEAISRALVELHSRGERMAFTDSNGQFEFDNLQAGRTTLTVRKPGYFDEREANGGDSPPAMTTLGPDTQPVVLKLVPQSVIYGRVQTPKGEAIEGIPVKVMSNRVVEGRKQWQQIAAAFTDEDGNFRVARLRPGSYYLEVGPSKDLGDSSSGDRGYPALFYPAANDISSATPFDLRPGQQAEADVSLASVRLFRVSGHLAGYIPNSGIDFEFIDHLGNHFSFLKAFHSDSGEFDAEVPAGSYILHVSNWIPNSYPVRAEAALNVDSDLAGVDLALGSMLPVSVNVRTEPTKSEEFQHHRQQDGQLVSVHLIPDGDTFERADVWSNWIERPQPSLVLRDALPGRYTVQVVPSGGSWYVQSSQCGETDLLNDDLTISPGVQPAPIDIVLRDDSATLTGRIRGASGRVPVRVLLVPDHHSAAQTKSLNVSSQDEFFIPNLAPGSYSVIAFDRGDTVEYTNPEVLNQYLSRAAHITLEPNGRQQITLDLINITN
jgi:hypothetical protein